MPNAQPKAVTTSTAILDGVALQNALRAALVVAPTKGKFAVLAVRLPSGYGADAAVCAYDPGRGTHISVSVPADHVQIADDRDRVVELTPEKARQLLAMKVKAPGEDEPLPSLSWDITEQSVTQSDDGQLFGRMSRVVREDRDNPTLGDIPATLHDLADAPRVSGGVAQLTPRQAKALGSILGHVGEDARMRALEPRQGQLTSCLVLSESLAVHCVIPDKDALQEMEDKAPVKDVSFADADVDTAASSLDPDGRMGLKIVRSNPPGGIA